MLGRFIEKGNSAAWATRVLQSCKIDAVQGCVAFHKILIHIHYFFFNWPDVFFMYEGEIEGKSNDITLEIVIVLVVVIINNEHMPVR